MLKGVRLFAVPVSTAFAADGVCQGGWLYRRQQWTGQPALGITGRMALLVGFLHQPVHRVRGGRDEGGGRASQPWGLLAGWHYWWAFSTSPSTAFAADGVRQGSWL